MNVRNFIEKAAFLFLCIAKPQITFAFQIVTKSPVLRAQRQVRLDTTYISGRLRLSSQQNLMSTKETIVSDVDNNGGSTNMIDVDHKLKSTSIEVNNTTNALAPVIRMVKEKVGSVDDDRLIFPELYEGGIPRMYSSLTYSKDEETGIIKAEHSSGSVVSAAASVAGATLGAGILALPIATASTGFLPSAFGLTTSWVYMTMSGLLLAELTLNRYGSTGKPGVGILDLIQNSLGKQWNLIGVGAYIFLHYAVIVACIAQGGNNIAMAFSSLGLNDLLSSVPGYGQLMLAGGLGTVLYRADKPSVEKAKNILAVGVAITFLVTIWSGIGTTNFGSLIDPTNQHPEEILNCLPIAFLCFVYQSVVPTIVSELEGDRNKISKAIVTGTAIPYFMLLAWNAVMIGNLNGMDLTDVDPLLLLQSVETFGTFGALVTVFSTLAIVSTLVRFSSELLNALSSTLNISLDGNDNNKEKASLYAIALIPPLLLSLKNSDIFDSALDFGGAFGVSALYLVLPPIMTWSERYGEGKIPLVTKPMVPLGKIPLGSMWKAAGTLIIEQGLEKLGIFDAIFQ